MEIAKDVNKITQKQVSRPTRLGHLEGLDSFLDDRHGITTHGVVEQHQVGVRVFPLSANDVDRQIDNAKDLDFPYKPSPTVLVSTWIEKVDLAVQGARISGRDDWTDEELYFFVGNKLQDNAAGWWVQMDQELPMAEKTWTHLTAALIRRYGERPDRAMAEWHVYQQMMYPGETFANFSAGLRDVTGQSHLTEPIDDPIDNVARGMVNIGQPWATAPNAYAVPIDGTMGRVAIISGVGTGADPTSDVMPAQTGGDSNEISYFTNPQGVYNKYTGTWDTRRRGTNTELADTVENAITTLDVETQAKRRQQAEDAQAKLARRRAGGAEPGVQRAQVRLAQRMDSGMTSAMTATRAMNDDGPTTDVTVAANDGLPTATIYVGNERLDVKLDSGAGYSVAGTDWMMRGKRLKKPAPVDCAEDIGGFLLNVIGVWTFHMRNAFGQLVEVRACIVDGCTDEVLIGVDFLSQHQTNIDFERNEVRYSEKVTTVVIPCRTENEGSAKNEDEVRIEHEEPEARKLMLWLLRAYREVSVNKGDCPPMTTLDVEHHIDTGTAAPILQKRRRDAQVEDAIIESNVIQMLPAGVIEESNGAWGFPVVLVKNKDGEVRFCVDYRALNKVTKKYVYPLPRIDETLEALGAAQLFTTLDLRYGYWQIGVAPADRDKTAFTTKQGLYRFQRVPFGLMNAPSTFQRMMNGVLRGLTWLTCLVYLDDIVVKLVTDASKIGLGACLMQDQGCGWQPVAFASKVNSNAEANYSITELECLAVVWSVKLFRSYLYGRSFTIVTDHAALKWHMTRPNLAGRLYRWSLTMQEYEFVIEYRPGVINMVADALSRIPAVVRMAIINRPFTRGAKKRLEAATTAAQRDATETVTDATRATPPDE
ncbi:unnamed protein product [Phytophthora fragariaefolia]|uniref:RNA-directed DNA polymerase n=1 Tax=Phytophthora fragariaefolia TaxID=1490495 RepID=A0A9W6XWF9_9STRA|nr:unnamed protein product [Phytophthora fragariaefolia]